MTRQYAYFQVTGSGTPDAITQAIGVAPTICNSDKNVNSKTGLPRDVMRWRLNCGELEDASVQQHVGAILLWLNRRPSAVRSLGDDYALTLHIACWATDTFGLHLTRDQVQILGRLGIAIDYDGYVKKSSSEAESLRFNESVLAFERCSFNDVDSHPAGPKSIRFQCSSLSNWTSGQPPTT